jgi:hypothetical protein
MDAARLSCDARRTSNRDNRSGQLIHFHPFPFAGKKREMSKSKLLLEGGSLFSVVVEFSNFHHKKKRKGKNIRSGRLSLCVDRQNVLRVT